jgi:hypothetical protein
MKAVWRNHEKKWQVLGGQHRGRPGGDDPKHVMSACAAFRRRRLGWRQSGRQVDGLSNLFVSGFSPSVGRGILLQLWEEDWTPLEPNCPLDCDRDIRGALVIAVPHFHNAAVGHTAKSFRSTTLPLDSGVLSLAILRISVPCPGVVQPLTFSLPCRFARLRRMKNK